MLDLGRAAAISGWMCNEELHWLHDRAMEYRSVLEIGSWCGRSTFALCSGCAGIVFAIDHFRGSDEHRGEIKNGKKPFAEYYENMKDFANLITIVADSVTASKHLSLEYDMLFIDGAHDLASVTSDLVAWGRGAKKLIAGHDWGYGTVNKAVQTYFPGEEIKTGPGTLWSVRRNG